MTLITSLVHRFDRLAKDRAQAFGSAPARIAKVDLVVMPARFETCVCDAGMEPVDGRAFVRLPADMQHLRDVGFLEPFGTHRSGDFS